VTDSLFGLSLSNSVNNNGAFIGGGQLGYNYQFGNFVLGIEGDFDGVANTNTAASGVVGPGIGPILLTSNNRWITTLAARVGVAGGRVGWHQSPLPGPFDLPSRYNPYGW
jgi:outer membrane immunogenic protein